MVYLNKIKPSGHMVWTVAGTRLLQHTNLKANVVFRVFNRVPLYV